MLPLPAAAIDMQGLRCYLALRTTNEIKVFQQLIFQSLSTFTLFETTKFVILTPSVTSYAKGLYTMFTCTTCDICGKMFGKAFHIQDRKDIQGLSKTVIET